MFKISLKAARVNAKLTLEEASKECHVSVQTMINWEKGRIIPDFRTLSFLSSLYNIPVDNILLPEKSTKS